MTTKPGLGWDFLVNNRYGQLVLVVEVKAKKNSSPEWVSKLLQNISQDEPLPKVPYLLMVFPDWFYLWTEDDLKSELSKPTYTIDAHPILKPYFQQARVTGDTISGSSFELIVASWLRDIIHSNQSAEETNESQQWLIDSGLYDALSGGNLYWDKVA